MTRNNPVHIIGLTALFVAVCLLGATVPVAQAATAQDTDMDGDGRKESKVYFEKNQIIKVQSDRDNDKYFEETVYYKGGVPERGERDTDRDRKMDTWMKYDAKGALSLMAHDQQRKDGKADYWKHLKKNDIYLREWDRNFDGRADLKSFETNKRVMEKEYDDNFDGKFEKKWKFPGDSETGTIKTTAIQNPNNTKP